MHIRSQRRVHPAVAVAATIPLEDLGECAAHVDIPVPEANRATVVEIGAARQVQRRQQFLDGMSRSQGVNQHRLLPIGQDLQVDAQVFFYDFVGLFQQVVFELKSSQLDFQCCQLLLHLGLAQVGRRFALAFHRCRRLSTE